MSKKIDGVGPVDNRPSTNMLHHIVKKKQKKRDMWHVTRDTWHVTCATWHVTRDMFVRVDILSKFQLPCSYRLWFTMLWRSGGKGSLNDLISDEAVYRTAPATPGLLKKELTCDRWHMTCDTWHVTRDTWHMTYDMFGVGGGLNILSKFQLPSSYRLWFLILWRSGGKGWLN